MTPRAVFGAKVDAAARLLLALLWTWAPNGDPSPFVWPSAALLASTLGCTDRSVRRSIKSLRDAGLIDPAIRTLSYKGGDHRVCGWVLAIPPPETASLTNEAWCASDNPGVERWADAFDHGADDAVRGSVEAVRKYFDPVDDAVRDDRTISSALPSMDLLTVSQRDPAPPAPDVTEPDLVSKILKAMRTACCDLRGRAGAGPDDCDANRSMIKRCNKAVRVRGQTDDALLADWQRVITSQLESVRHHPHTWRYLTLSTIAAPKNFLRMRDQAAVGARGSSGEARKPWSSQRDDDEDATP